MPTWTLHGSRRPKDHAGRRSRPARPRLRTLSTAMVLNRARQFGLYGRTAILNVVDLHCLRRPSHHSSPRPSDRDRPAILGRPQDLMVAPNVTVVWSHFGTFAFLRSDAVGPRWSFEVDVDSLVGDVLFVVECADVGGDEGFYAVSEASCGFGEGYAGA